MLIADVDPGGQILLWTLLLDRENQFGVVESVSLPERPAEHSRVMGFIQGAGGGGMWVMATPRCPQPSIPVWPWMELPCPGMLVLGLVLQGKVHLNSPWRWRLTLGGWDGLSAPHSAQVIHPSHIQGGILLSHICCPPGMLEKTPLFFSALF